jgi:hypothetical protein
LDPLGPVGELTVDAASGDVKAYTPIEDMKNRTLKLYEQHRERIPPPFRVISYLCANFRPSATAVTGKAIGIW